MLEIKDLAGKTVLGSLKHPDDSGTATRWAWVLAVLNFISAGLLAHHCGKICQKVEKGNHWHSPTYECGVCKSRFWTWAETG